MSTINIVKLIAKPKDAISNYFSLILKLKNRRKGGFGIGDSNGIT